MQNKTDEKHYRIIKTKHKCHEWIQEMYTYFCNPKNIGKHTK